MITAQDITDSGNPAARLRPAGTAPLQAAQQPGGPFEVAAETRKPTVRDALVTGLMVVYPVFAALAAILAGLFLTSGSGV
ncbi:hypothetical protein [Mesorhizobium sp.]|uniref:hypothetical protein n=1 Tax=Mesorhizobium sp. TaxID=1871066 RepID=UPI000FE7AA62|nr:hypothetical protein [Mesorhizobium sp.]RWE31714.1 MAG: hypothetical protein EOS77_16370 [Mesorhizobium sp.]